MSLQCSVKDLNMYLVDMDDIFGLEFAVSSAKKRVSVIALARGGGSF